MSLDDTRVQKNSEDIPLSNVNLNSEYDLSKGNTAFHSVTRTESNDSYLPNDENQLPRRSYSDKQHRVLAGPSSSNNEPSDFRRHNTSPNPFGSRSSHQPSTLNTNLLPPGAYGPYGTSYSPTSAVSQPPSEGDVTKLNSVSSSAAHSNLSGPHAYGNNDPSLRAMPHKSYNTEDNDKSRLLNTVPEEDSDSSDDDYVEIKDIMGDLETNKMRQDLKHSHSDDDSDGNVSGATTPRRRGLRHYARKEKKSEKKNGKSTKVIKYLRNLVLSLIKFSLIARCFFYWLPLAIILFVPLAVGAWAKPDATLGEARLMWIFIWLEIVWGSLWVSRIFASSLPHAYKIITSIIAPGLKKYKSVLQALEVPITLVFWALVSLCTFMPVMTQKANAKSSDATQTWQRVINNILVALLISSLVFFAERLMIHLISVSFHKTRFASRIKDNKQSIRTLSDLLYFACIPFPPFCPEFSEEDLVLQSGSFFKGNPKDSALASKLASNHNLQRFFGRVNHAFDFATMTLGKVARGQSLENDEIRSWVSNTIADAMNSEALAEILAKRIWMSLVLEGEEHLTIEDLIEILGQDRRADSEAIFRVLDIDGNGNLTLDEMISAVVEICHERRSVYKSLKDVDSAIQKLHEVLLFIVLIIIIIVFIGMLAPSVSAVLATLGTSILALSFVFSTTAQEITASCVFLFVKHPLDVGDRVDIANDSYFVKEISLLYTVFTRVLDGSVVQAPNSVLNTLWIDNLSRAGPMTLTFTLVLGVPETSFTQLEMFVDTMNQFCLDNSRDYQPDPFISCTGFPDLDRVNFTCAVTFRSNFADGKLYSTRRNKLIHFMGRLIHDLGISIPRREDSSTDPGLPLHISPSHSAAKLLQESGSNFASDSSKRNNPFDSTSGATNLDQKCDNNELLDTISQQQKQRAQTNLFPQPRALMGFGPGGSDLIQFEDADATAGSGGDAETSSVMEQVQSPSITQSALHRDPTTVSRTYTIASKASGVSRRTTVTGRRRRE